MALCCLTVSIQKLSAQALLDLTMNNIPQNSDKLEVRLRPTKAVTNGSYSAGVFTVRFPIAFPGTLSVVPGSSVYGYSFAAPAGDDGVFKYYRFQFAQVYNVNWDACKDTLIAVLQYSNGPANGAFELVTGVPWTNNNN